MSQPTLDELLEFMNAGNCLIPDTPMTNAMRHYSAEGRKITARINYGWHEPEEIIILMEELTGKKIDASFRLFTPFYTDFGKNIHLGKNVFINSCCNFQDQGGIYLGDNVLVGHQVVIATINHGLKPGERDYNYVKPVHIADNAWIGAGARIMPGVSIGANSVIGAGSVVTRDVPENTVVAGVPAKIIKNIPAD